MDNKKTFQEKNERLKTNNTSLTDILDTINDLSSGGGGIGEYFHLDTQPTSGYFYRYYIKAIPSVDVSKYTSLRKFCDGLDELERVDSLNIENCTDVESMFSGCKKLKSIGDLKNSNKVTTVSQIFYNCYELIEAPNIDTSNVTLASSMFGYCRNIMTVPEYDFSKVQNIQSMFNQNLKLANIGGFKNLGKGYVVTTANNIICTLDLTPISNRSATYESLMNIINKLYDLNLTYDVANGGTLYTQQLVLGSSYLAKLTVDEIAIATNKGWTVS